MRVLAFIQARMGSSRLPGKVLMPIGGKPLLSWMFNRLRPSKFITETVLLTSEEWTDNELAAFCDQAGQNYFRGSENNVLERFYLAASGRLRAEDRKDALILRLTGDCPLIDVTMIDAAVEEMIKARDLGCRYFGYSEDLPDGLDFEIFTWDALAESFFNAQDPFEKEHVTPYMWRRPNHFGLRRYVQTGFLKGLRFSVDYPEDLILVERILQEEKRTGRSLTGLEISEFLKSHPEVRAINENVIKNEGLIKSTLLSPDSLVNTLDTKLPRLGLVVTANMTNIDQLVGWCTFVGIRAWLSPSGKIDNLKLPGTVLRICPPNWQTVAWNNSSWKMDIKRALVNANTGVFIEAPNYKSAAEMLLYACQGRFD